MRKIAVAMAKGGVGKTTTAVSLAHGLARQGRNVLLVDGDTQGQAARFLGVKPTYGLYEFITGIDEHNRPVPKKETLYPCRNRMWLLAGGIKLVELKNWLGEQPRDIRHRVLAGSLVPKGGGLDYLIFDCALTFGVVRFGGVGVTIFGEWKGKSYDDYTREHLKIWLENDSRIKKEFERDISIANAIDEIS